MNYKKGIKSQLNQIEAVGDNKYEIKLSVRDYTPTNKESDDELEDVDNYDVEYFSTIVQGPVSTYALKQILHNLQDEYDKSDFVNSFIVDGKKAWMDKNTRVGLVNSCNVLELKGEEEYTLWFNNKPYTLSISDIKQALINIEEYAMKCYNVTEQHHAEINTLTTRDEILNYNITKGYPDKLIII